MVATASVQGTLIRIFNSKTGELLKELRRGSFPAEIYSLAFSNGNQLCAVFSSTGTIHIFDLLSESNRSIITYKIGLSLTGVLSFVDRSHLAIALNSGVLTLFEFNDQAKTMEIRNETNLYSLIKF